MQTFLFIVFLVSAIALPAAALAIMNSSMRALGKGILLVVLAFAARYLLWAVWTPEEMWLLYCKAFAMSVALYVVWFPGFMKIIDTECADSMRPWVAFGSTMLFPLFLSLTFCGPLFSGSAHINSAAFWVGWTILGLLRAALLPRKVTIFSRVIMVGMAVALLSFYLLANTGSVFDEYFGRLGEYLRKNVVERWEPIKRSTEKIVSAWDALVDMDRRAMANGKVGARKVVASKMIKEQIAKLRDDLLTVDSRAVLARVTKLDAKIASAKKDLSELREKRGLDPDRSEKLDAKIAKAEAELAALETSRAEAVATVRRDLKEIGLSLPENSPFLTVDLGALIDNAIVAKNIGFVVENLKGLVDAEKGNAEAAKRYYGAYIVMLDVQAECFRQYLDKAATGIWRDGIVDVAKNAEAAKKGNETKAAAEGRSEEEKKAYLHAAGTNEKTLKAAQAYLAILKRHEEIIREKLSATEKRHEIALSFWESVDIASSFGARAVSDMTDFAALLELKLPEIALFDDVAMKAEFDAITQKLMKE